MAKYNPAEMTADEKRAVIDKSCDKYKLHSGGCITCPFNSPDENAWCDKGFVEDIPEQELEGLISVINAYYEKEV